MAQNFILASLASEYFQPQLREGITDLNPFFIFFGTYCLISCGCIAKLESTSDVHMTVFACLCPADGLVDMFWARSLAAILARRRYKVVAEQYCKISPLICMVFFLKL